MHREHQDKLDAFARRVRAPDEAEYKRRHTNFEDRITHMQSRMRHQKRIEDEEIAQQHNAHKMANDLSDAFSEVGDNETSREMEQIAVEDLRAAFADSVRVAGRNSRQGICAR